MDKAKYFYVTTPIYYPSGNLHLGHAYTTTLADILNRYKQSQGYETFFLTGSDEHGQKIEKKALEMGLAPLAYLDEKVELFKTLWTKLGIGYSKFIRTTDHEHTTTVKKIFTKLLDKGYIYPGFYEGLYCVSCEEFLNPDQIDENGLCKVSHDAPQLVKEETYFLKVSSFQDFISELLSGEFILPVYRQNEMLKNFVDPGLKDLSITRVSFAWGIPISEDPKHVVYVWLDALTNYLTALGYLQDDGQLFEKFWSNQSEIVQLVGKEITRFHAIYWPTILKMLDLRMPDKLLSHGWIVNDGEKMSKSLGNVIDPIAYINQYGADGLRFYLAYELPINKDGNFSESMFIESFNAHLANNVGNLISRVNNMISKYFDGYLGDDLTITSPLMNQKINQVIDDFQQLMDEYDLSGAVRKVLDFSSFCNKYIEEQMPWVLAKEEKLDQLKVVLMDLQKAMTTISYLLKPVLVFSYPLMVDQCGVSEPEVLSYAELKTYQNLKFKKLGEKKVLFERIKPVV